MNINMDAYKKKKKNCCCKRNIPFGLRLMVIEASVPYRNMFV